MLEVDFPPGYLLNHFHIVRASRIILALCMVSGCVEDIPAPSTDRALPLRLSVGAQRQIQLAASGRRTRGFEDELLRLEGRIPGIGGLYREGGRELVMYLKDISDRDAALLSLKAIAPSMNVDSEMRGLMANGQVTVRKGDFSFPNSLTGMRGLALR